MAIGFVIYSVYRIAVDGYTNSRLFVGIGGLLSLYGYSSVAEEVKQKEDMTVDPNEKLAQDWYEKKTALMVDILGREHDIGDACTHSVLDRRRPGFIYYFPTA